jgi:hypothetical protein
MFKKLVYPVAKLSQANLKQFAIKRLPIYILGLIILIVFGVKPLMYTLGLFVFFFLGWIMKGLYQSIIDWRMQLRMNRIHFSQVEYEQLKRENNMLHDALNVFKEHAKTGRGGVGAPMPQAPPPKPRFDPQQMHEMILQMKEENGQ